MTVRVHDLAERLAKMVATWSAAADAWNPAALTVLYCEDAVLFGGRAGHASGQAELQAYFASYDGVILSASLALNDQQILDLGGSTMLAQGFGEFAFTLATGETRQRMRTTWLLDWTSGDTRIRAHHFSPEPSAPPLGD